MISKFPARTHFITFEQAVDLTTRFRSMKEQMLDPSMRNKNVLPLSEAFHREAFDYLLNETGCAGIKLYLGMDESDQVRLIAVAVNSDNEDLLPATMTTAAATEGNDDEIVEDGFRCPDMCDPLSPLNS